MAVNKQLALCLCTVSAFAVACANPPSSKPAEGSAAGDPGGYSIAPVAGLTTSDDERVHIVTATEQTRLELGVASYEITTQDSRRISVRALDASGHELGTLAIAQAENGVTLLTVQSGASNLELTLSEREKAVVTSVRLDGRAISVDELTSSARAAPVQGATVRGDVVRVFSRFDQDRQQVGDLRAHQSEFDSGPCIACVASALSTLGTGLACTGVVLTCLEATVVTIGGTSVPCWLAITATCGSATGSIIAAINNCSSCVNQCQPATCASWSFRVCGPQADGCGHTINCDCTPGNTCSAQQLCVPACVPQTCAAHSGECGTFNDGCGGSISCGSYDSCGVCNGDGSSCECPWYDSCGVCEGDGSSCAGCPWYDACGVCQGDGSSCAGCPWYDACGVCEGDGSSCGGCAWYDACGVCEGDGSSCSDPGGGGGGGGGGGDDCDLFDDCGCEDDPWGCQEDIMTRAAPVPMMMRATRTTARKPGSVTVGPARPRRPAPAPAQ